MFKKAFKRTLPIGICVIIGSIIACIFLGIEAVIHAIPIDIGLICGVLHVKYSTILSDEDSEA